GLRQAEMLTLKWDDVDIETAEVRVRGTKTQNSRRTIELSSTTVAQLRSHRQAQRQHRLRLGPAWHEHGLVFPSSIGTPWLRRPFYRDYKMVVAISGVDDPASVKWHTLRHTAATLWIKGSVDIYTVSRRLGHASAAFTMDVYGHLLKGQQQHAAGVLDHLLA
ncbi:MAG: site-specific integrase, partial [Dehalococcoidia bacterium]|nr:site-specific integrase [Dehalococcoidia bacterium]